MNKLGSHAILAKMPIWATALIGLVTLMVIPAGRYFFEGLSYDVSFASSIGDKVLLVVVLIAATILQRGACVVPDWLQSRKLHYTFLLSSFAVGIAICVFTLNSRQGREMDAWHDVIVVPLFMYLAITLLPVVFRFENGGFVNAKGGEVVAALLCIMIWAGSSMFDAHHGLLTQRVWLSQHANLVWCMRY